MLDRVAIAGNLKVERERGAAGSTGRPAVVVAAAPRTASGEPSGSQKPNGCHGGHNSCDPDLAPSLHRTSLSQGAWVPLRLFVEINEWRWSPTPTIDDAEAAVQAIAAGEWNDGTAR
jgi:hypothetical protein